MAVPHFPHTFNVPLFVPLQYIIRIILALIGINLYIHKATFLLLVKKTCSTAASFQVFLFISMFVSLPFGRSLTFLLAVVSLQSLTPSCNLGHRSILIAFILLFLVLWPLPSRRYCFWCLGCYAVLHLSAIFTSNHHFYCHAIIIAAVDLVVVKPDSNHRSFHSRLDRSFLLGCCFCHGSIVATFMLLLMMHSL